LLSPKKHVPKLYYAKVQGEVTQKEVEAFQKGIQLDPDFKTLPAKLHILHSGAISEVEIEIQEGKFHQIKRMFLSQNQEVLYLKRLKMGNLQLDPDLPIGQYRELKIEEVNSLLKVE
jgi:16S rRNA pseudouridine516 synthase